MTIERIILIPTQKTDVTFKNTVIDHEYLLTGKYVYVLMDLPLMKECQLVNRLKICRRQQPDFLTYKWETYDSSLINIQSKAKCQILSFLLQPETYLFKSDGFLAIYTSDERIDVACKGTNEPRMLNKGTYNIHGND